MSATDGEFAPAKVNLFLHVTGRRADGYHLLDSLAVFPAIGDRLDYAPDPEFTLELRGRFAAGLSTEPDNLVLRAGRALAHASGVHAHGRLTLDKQLPVASGIGGGSADAAAALRLLSRVWNARLPEGEMRSLALGLGADVPACLDSKPLRMSGIGEMLNLVPPLPACGIVLVNPLVGVATPEVFRGRRGPFSPPAALAFSWPDLGGLLRDLAPTANDLQEPAVRLCPEIAELLAALRAHPSCKLARMSGSGATCFALCADPATAVSMAADLANPAWWCWGGGLASPLPLWEGPGEG